MSIKNLHSPNNREICQSKNFIGVTLRGMKYSVTGVVEGISYVVAEDAEKAYQKVKKRLD